MIFLEVRRMLLRTVEETKHARITESRSANVTVWLTVLDGKISAKSDDLPILALIQGQRDTRRLGQHLADLVSRYLSHHTDLFAIEFPLSVAHAVRRPELLFENASSFAKRQRL